MALSGTRSTIVCVTGAPTTTMDTIDTKYKMLSAPQRNDPEKKENKSKNKTFLRQQLQKQSNYTEQEKENIQGTNDSSIVSKYSAELVYAKPAYSFFKLFIPEQRIKRRSPIINRGYWLRMRSVENAVLTFLSETQACDHRRVIINLGCGYDPLPFQFLAQRIHRNVLFVDIDYPALMANKVKTVVSDTSLSSLLTNVQTESETGIGPQLILRSEEYLAVGCDLEDLEWLSVLFKEESLHNAKLFFSAEVSITYMRSEAADKVLQWAASFPDARFSLLEQILPDGPEHPFASTMLRHFEKLRTPLQSVNKYPTPNSQVNRFLTLGWKSAASGNLLNVWFNIFTCEERKAVWRAEPFDEWEEFFLFCQHYCLVSASTSTSLDNGLYKSPLPVSNQVEVKDKGAAKFHNWRGENIRHVMFKKRFAAGVKLNEHQMLFHGGMASTGGRTADFHIVGDEPQKGHQQSIKISPRMCHTATNTGTSSVLIAGGRNSPTQLINNCVFFKDGLSADIKPLPQARYRHCAVGNGCGLVVLFGGIGEDNRILSNWVIWDGITWSQPSNDLATEDSPSPRFAASMCWNPVKQYGLLTGGIGEDGIVLDDLWKIRLENHTIICERLNVPSSRLLRRFGAQLAHLNGKYSNGDEFFLVGGVGGREVLSQRESIIRIKICQDVVRSLSLACNEIEAWRSLLVGHIVELICDGTVLLIAGGGSGCFSFGALWNENLWVLERHSSGSKRNLFIDQQQVISNETSEDQYKLASAQKDSRKSHYTGSVKKIPTLLDIPRTTITSENDFCEIMSKSMPVVIENLDIGPCIEKWTWEYLKDRVGSGRKVVVHVASEEVQQMSFLKKNFTYQKMDFGDFIDTIARDEGTQSSLQNSSKGPYEQRLYLRSLSSLSPNSKPANLKTDFPSISPDLIIPTPLVFASQNHHSSPLRISSLNIGMWLHFDVMSNILIHIRGEKRFRLYPPSDILNLSFPPGASSSTIENPFETDIPGSHPLETTLKPGDILYIPGLWPHAALPLTSCVAVNVFFRDLEGSVYAPGKDVYGNRDLGAYEKGRQMVARVVKEFGNVPKTARRFYLERLAMELLDKAREDEREDEREDK